MFTNKEKNLLHGLGKTDYEHVYNGDNLIHNIQTDNLLQIIVFMSNSELMNIKIFKKFP